MTASPALMGVVRSGLAVGVWLLASWPPAASAKAFVIVIDDVAFAAAPTDARVGDVIQWKNRDFVAHTATARDGSFDVDLPASASVEIELTRPGEIAFFCRYHPGMTGTITVGR